MNPEAIKSLDPNSQLQLALIDLEAIKKELKALDARIVGVTVLQGRLLGELQSIQIFKDRVLAMEKKLNTPTNLPEKSKSIWDYFK